MIFLIVDTYQVLAFCTIMSMKEEAPRLSFLVVMADYFTIHTQIVMALCRILSLTMCGYSCHGKYSRAAQWWINVIVKSTVIGDGVGLIQQPCKFGTRHVCIWMIPHSLENVVWRTLWLQHGVEGSSSLWPCREAADRWRYIYISLKLLSLVEIHKRYVSSCRV